MDRAHPQGLQGLAEAIAAKTEAALRSGALVPIPTLRRHIADDGMDALVFVVENLARKEQALGAPRAAGAPERQSAVDPRRPDPFLPPYDPDLFVTDLTPTHICLLNKYNVVEHHALIVTRRFEPQEDVLGAADFEALGLGLAAVDGLGFYNGGQIAGASQPHKHLQLIPALDAPGLRVPLERRLPGLPAPSGPRLLPELPFACAGVGLAATDRSPERLLERYLELFEILGERAVPGAPQPLPYNLLVTRDWMLLVPRREERWEGLSINAMGFAGTLLARSEAEAERIAAAGPSRILSAVAGSTR